MVHRALHRIGRTDPQGKVDLHMGLHMGLQGEDPTVVNLSSVMKLSCEGVHTRIRTVWLSSLLSSLGFMGIGHRTSILWCIKIGRRLIMGEIIFDDYQFLVMLMCFYAELLSHMQERWFIQDKSSFTKLGTTESSVFRHTPPTPTTER